MTGHSSMYSSSFQMEKLILATKEFMVETQWGDFVFPVFTFWCVVTYVTCDMLVQDSGFEAGFGRWTYVRASGGLYGHKSEFTDLLERGRVALHGKYKTLSVKVNTGSTHRQQSVYNANIFIAYHAIELQYHQKILSFLKRKFAYIASCWLAGRNEYVGIIFF